MHNRYKIVVGNAVAFGFADTQQRALKVGHRLARQYPGERTAVSDMKTGKTFARIRYPDCPGCG